MIQNIQMPEIHTARSITIISVVQEYLLHHPRQEAFADDVVRIYHERTPEQQRSIHFRTDDSAARFKANWQKLFRMINGAVKMIADIEEAIVLALPPKQSQRLVSMLAGRYGLMAVSMPKTTSNAAVASVAEVLRDTGKMLEPFAEILSDGKIDDNDRALAPVAMAAIDKTLADLMSWKVQLQSIFPDINSPDTVVPFKEHNTKA